uniref:TBC1 domain family, member 32 n=1 Tax=Cyprinus carpio TaxID=7962 RepID=A0A8C2H6S7_CYPCA
IEWSSINCFSSFAPSRLPPRLCPLSYCWFILFCFSATSEDIQDDGKLAGFLAEVILCVRVLLLRHPTLVHSSYEFVKYLREYVESSLGTVIEEETENFTRGDSHAIGPGQDTLVHAVTKRTRESTQYKQMMQTLKQTMMVVVESLINKFEEDQLKKEEMDRKSQHEQSSSHYTDNCSDSDSSFNQVIV